MSHFSYSELSQDFTDWLWTVDQFDSLPDDVTFYDYLAVCLAAAL